MFGRGGMLRGIYRTVDPHRSLRMQAQLESSLILGASHVSGADIGS